jgi:amidase
LTFLKIQLNQWFESLVENPSGVRSLADLIQFDDNNPKLEEPPQFTDQSECVCFNGISLALLIDMFRFTRAEATEGFNDAYFTALAFDHDLGSTRGIDAALKLHQLDALVLPATGFTTVPAGKLLFNYHQMNEVRTSI